MNKLTLRCSILSVFVVSLLLITALGAAAADESLQSTTPQARETSRASAVPQAVNLRSEDLVKWGIASVTKEACHGWVSCQPDYPSCAGWTGFIYACGEPQCLLGPYCVECTEESCPTEAPYMSAPVERFRVCFDQFGNSCTEWQLVDYPGCGCEL